MSEIDVTDEVFDNTKCACYKKCPRKFYWAHRRHSRSSARRAPLDYGQAMHKGLATYYSTDLDKDKMIEAFCEEMIKYKGDEKRNIQTGHKALGGYHDLYGVSDKELEIIGVELMVPFELGRYLMVVIVDTLVKNQYGLLSLEHKTTSQFGEQWPKSMKPNGQFTTQVYGVKEFMIELHGIMVNAIKTVDPNSKKYKENKYTYDELYRRDITTRTKFELDQWVTSTLYWLDRIAWSTENNYYPMNDNDESCIGRWGECEYRVLCMMGRPPEDIIVEEMEMFYIEKWEPDKAHTDISKIIGG